MITLSGVVAFCASCGSQDLSIMKEEDMLRECSNDGSEFVLKCRCGCYWSQKFIEDNIDEFTSDDKRQRIMEKRMELRKYYDRFRVASEEAEGNVEVTEKVRKKRILEGRRIMAARQQRTLGRETTKE